MKPGGTSVSSLMKALRQGLTLVHFSAQHKRFLWDRRCIHRSFEGLFVVCQGVSGGIQGCSGCILCQKRLRLS